MNEESLRYYSRETLYEIFEGLGYQKGGPAYIYYRLLEQMNASQQQEEKLFELDCFLSCWRAERHRFKNPSHVGLVLFCAFTADDVANPANIEGAARELKQALTDLALIKDGELLRPIFSSLLRAARNVEVPVVGDASLLNQLLQRPIVHLHDSRFSPGTLGFEKAATLCGRSLPIGKLHYDFSDGQYIACPSCTHVSATLPVPA